MIFQIIIIMIMMGTIISACYWFDDKNENRSQSPSEACARDAEAFRGVSKTARSPTKEAGIVLLSGCDARFIQEMSTCRTCKNWVVTDGLEPIMGRCNSDKVTAKWPEGSQIMESYDEDLSGIPHLITGPDFGCVHHQSK